MTTETILVSTFLLLCVGLFIFSLITGYFHNLFELFFGCVVIGMFVLLGAAIFQSSGFERKASDPIMVKSASGETMKCSELRELVGKHDVLEVRSAASWYKNYLKMKNSNASEEDLDLFYPPRLVTEKREIISSADEDRFWENRSILRNGEDCVKKWFVK